jgi:predicted HTH domain antitoxin
MHEQLLRDQVTSALAELQDEQLLILLEVLRMLRSKREVLLLDETDRKLLRALAARHGSVEVWQGVIDDYLNERISIGRAAELLGIPVLDLRSRFQKLGISLRWGAQSVEEAQEEINATAALSASEKRQQGMSSGL